jgi:hypothetical protein
MPYCQGLEMNLSNDENDFENGTKKRLNNQLNTKQANHNRIAIKLINLLSLALLIFEISPTLFLSYLDL